MAVACDRIATDLANGIARTKGGSRRYQAIAELTHLMLRLTRFNLLGFAAFAREVAPVRLAHRELSPPERSLRRKDYRYTGIGFSSLSLCHGVAPFKKLHLPGGAPIRAEIARFDKLFRSFTARYAHTPFALAAYRSGIARYSLVGLGKNLPPPKRTPKSSGTQDATTRPSRGGPSGKGSSTTSGGG